MVILPLFAEEDIDEFLRIRGRVKIGDLPYKLDYLRDNQIHLFRYRPQDLRPNDTLTDYISPRIKDAKESRNRVCHSDRFLVEEPERVFVQECIIRKEGQI